MLVKFYVHSCICWWGAAANKDKIYEGGGLLSPYYYHKWNADHKKL